MGTDSDIGKRRLQTAVPQTEGHDISCPYKTNLKKRTFCATWGNVLASHGEAEVNKARAEVRECAILCGFLASAAQASSSAAVPARVVQLIGPYWHVQFG
jgi:hypothetical protein